MTPYLLRLQSLIVSQLSGIGNQTELKQFGITPVVNLPGVGLNLQGKFPTLRTLNQFAERR